jgi:Zn-dependent peptidase ImmA (M78 family)
VTVPRRPGDRRAVALRRLYAQRFGEVTIPVPVDAIAEDLLGLWVTERDDMECSGMLVPSRREIWLNARETRQSPARRRFTLAHEIGHWICHCRRAEPGEILCRTADVEAPSDPREREANVFAADLLMPDDAVREAHAAGTPTAQIAVLMGVSLPAMEWRLYNLSLVDDMPSSTMGAT